MQRMLTVHETAERLRQSRDTIRNWIHSGRLPASLVGQKYLIPESTVEEMAAPRSLKKLTREESRRLRDELLAETRAAGVTPDTYQKVIARRRAIAAEARGRTTRGRDGSSS